MTDQPVGEYPEFPTVSLALCEAMAERSAQKIERLEAERESLRAEIVALQALIDSARTARDLMAARAYTAESRLA